MERFRQFVISAAAATLADQRALGHEIGQAARGGRFADVERLHEPPGRDPAFATGQVDHLGMVRR